MDKFEFLKSKTIQFSIEMNMLRLSEFTIEQISNIDKDLGMIPILSKEINDKKNLKQLKTLLDENKRKLKKDLYEDCIEEYREIKDDLKFRSTKDGRLIIELEVWVQKLRKEINIKFQNKKLFVGRSFIDPKELIIGGIVEKIDEIQYIKDFINKHCPPVIPIYQFELKE